MFDFNDRATFDRGINEFRRFNNNKIKEIESQVFNNALLTAGELDMPDPMGFASDAVEKFRDTQQTMAPA